MLAAIAIGAVHVATEVAFSLTVARVYNVIAATAVAVYVVWRFWATKGVARVWGFRRDTLWSSLLAQLAFAIPAAAVLYALGLFLGSVPLPSTFWLAAALYPFWGIAQQFALQNMIARNLKGLIPRDVPCAFVSASLFALAHFPRLPLVALAFAAGLCFTLIYQRHPNLWSVGFLHGLLGVMAFYLVLQEDPGRRILEFIDASAKAFAA